MNDQELEELFADPAHREVVDLLKASRPAAPPLDPHFRSYLRAKLMSEAQRTQAISILAAMLMPVLDRRDQDLRRAA